jgi:hypothetical protein
LLGPPPVPFEQPVEVEVWRFSDVVWPASGRILSGLGPGNESGLTLATERSDEVRAAARGSVRNLEEVGPGRFKVVIDHENETSSTYANLSETRMAAGQRVERRQVIGRSSAGRLQFELTYRGEAVDPLRFLPASFLDPSLGGASSAVCQGEAIVADPASSLNVMFVSDQLRSYAVKDVSVRPASAGLPEVQARPKGLLGVLVTVPPLAPESHGRLAYQLETVFSNGIDSRVASCELLVMRANAVPGPGAAEVRLTPTATASPKPTSTTLVPHTRTPSPTVASGTPAVKTPNASSTRTPGPRR